MPVGTVAPEITLIVGAVIVLLVALAVPRDTQWVCAILALGVLGTVGAMSALQLGGGQGLTFQMSYAVDDAAVWTKLFVLAAAALAVLLSVPSLRGDAREGEYYTILLLATLGVVLLGGAADLMEVILGVLLASIGGYVLTAYDRGSPKASEAAMKYYLFGALTNLGLLYGFALLFGSSGQTLFAQLPAGWADGARPAIAAGAVLVVAGIGFKIAFVPVHFWMPDVLEGTRTPVAAYLSVVPKMGALLALARFVGVLPDWVEWRLLLAVVAALTMTLGNLAAMPQTNVKRLLAYSSVSWAGYLLMGVVVMGRGPAALTFLLYAFAAYAAANMGAFGVVARAGERIEDYAGLARERPVLALAMALSLLSLVGIPPLGGFVAKLGLFEAAIDGGYAWLAVVAAVNTVASLYYYVRVIAPMYLGTGYLGTGYAPAKGSAARGGWSAAAVLLSTTVTLTVGMGASVLLGPLGVARLLP